MKFKFKVQQYQTDAVESTVAIFNGQKNYEHSTYLRDMGEKYRRERANELKFSDEDATTGYRNHALELTDIELFDNIKKIQGANNIMLSQSLVKHIGRCSLDIEMETGTGKTYVYIKTIFELTSVLTNF